MIQAQHTGWAHTVFYPYLRWLLGKHFCSLEILGKLPPIRPEHPLLVLPNHSTWWDGFFVYLLNRVLLQRSLYLMMLEEQLARHPFFRRVGAYSIQPGNPKSVLASLTYTCDLLKLQGDPRPAVCFFPQGELLPWGVHPLEYQRGLEWLLRQQDEPVQILLLAMRAEFLGEQRPSAFFLFGQPQIVDATSFPETVELQKQGESLLRDLAERLNQGEPGRPLLHGRRSLSERFGQ